MAKIYQKHDMSQLITYHQEFKDQRILFKAILVAIPIYLMLKIFSFQKTLDICKKLLITKKNYQVNFATIQGWSYELIHANGIFKDCLIRSLVLYCLFKRTFPELTMMIGVSNQLGFKAHAWLENRGEVIDYGSGDFKVILKN